MERAKKTRFCCDGKLRCRGHKEKETETGGMDDLLIRATKFQVL